MHQFVQTITSPIRGLALAFSLFPLAAISSCATYTPVNSAFHQVLTAPYQLDAGDVVRITVFQHSDLTNTYAVGKGGEISFPLIGIINARGRSTTDVEGEIAARLSQGYVRDPNVSAEIYQYRPYFVMGEVKGGGQYNYSPGMTAQNAIATAGGFSTSATHKTVDITRKVNGKILTARVPTTEPIFPGDTVYVRERLF